MYINNHALTIDTVTIDLPRLAVWATVHIWSVPVVYCDNGYFVSTQMVGQPMEIPACDGRETAYLGSLPLEADITAVVLLEAQVKRDAITAAGDAALAPLGAEYGVWERATWDQQVREAEAVLADPTAATPMLASMCNHRGDTVQDLAQRVLANRASWSSISGDVIGQRQALDKQVAAAAALGGQEALDAIRAIEVRITLPDLTEAVS